MQFSRERSGEQAKERQERQGYQRFALEFEALQEVQNDLYVMVTLLLSHQGFGQHNKEIQGSIGGQLLSEDIVAGKRSTKVLILL